MACQKFPGYSVGTMQRPDHLPKPPRAVPFRQQPAIRMFFGLQDFGAGHTCDAGASSIVHKYDDTVVIASKAITVVIDPAAGLSGRLVLQGQFESALEHFERVLADVFLIITMPLLDAALHTLFSVVSMRQSADFDGYWMRNPDNGRALVGRGCFHSVAVNWIRH